MTRLLLLSILFLAGGPIINAELMNHVGKDSELRQNFLSWAQTNLVITYPSPSHPENDEFARPSLVLKPVWLLTDADIENLKAAKSDAGLD